MSLSYSFSREMCCVVSNCPPFFFNSPLYPLTCQNLNLRFIAIKEQLHTIDLVQLVDNDTGFVTNLRNCLCFMAEASFGALNQNLSN